MNDLNIPQYRALVDFHFKGLQGMYFSEYLTKNGYTALFSDLVEDSYYNYIAFVDRDVVASINDSKSMFIKRNRKPAIYSSPGSSTYNNEKIIPNRFKVWAADAWMTLENEALMFNARSNGSISVREIRYEEREDYVHTFHVSYAGDNPTDPYANLPEYYSQSLLRSFDNTPNGFETLYFWAMLGDKPVGVASMVCSPKIAGVYGVGTIEQYRRNGIGAALMQHAVKQAAARRIPTIVLQTESQSTVERWYQSLGFDTKFVAKYYVAEY